MTYIYSMVIVIQKKYSTEAMEMSLLTGIIGTRYDSHIISKVVKLKTFT